MQNFMKNCRFALITSEMLKVKRCRVIGAKFIAAKVLMSELAPMNFCAHNFWCYEHSLLRYSHAKYTSNNQRITITC